MTEFEEGNKADEYLQGLTIASIEACCRSLRANRPLTDEQMEELTEIYERLLIVQKKLYTYH